MLERIYDVEKLGIIAANTGACSDGRLHAASQGAFEMQRQLRRYERQIDREIRKRDKKKGLTK